MSVFGNGRSILHKGDGRVQTSGTPDVCKTPSPGGPVTIPYPNIAKDSDLSDGTTSVKIEGNPVALQSSSLATSTGDEAGTAGGGVVSSKTKGKCTWVAASSTVMFEGKGVVRFLDTCLHNGNTSNAGGQPAQGAPGAGGGGGGCNTHSWERLKDDDTTEDRIKALENDTGNAGSALQRVPRAEVPGSRKVGRRERALQVHDVRRVPGGRLDRRLQAGRV